MDKGGNARQRAVRTNKTKRERGETLAQDHPAPDQGILAPQIPWWRKFAGPALGTVSSVVLTMFITRGYLEWIPNWALALIWLASLLYWVSVEGRIRSRCKAHPKLISIGLMVLALIVAVGVRFRMPLWAVVHPSKDAPYVPPSGHKAVRIDGNLNATHLHCYDLPEDKQIECLCPRPVDYVLSALPTPPDNNYATLVDIKIPQDPMYRVQMFARSPIFPGAILEAFPYGKDQAAIGVGEWQVDQSTLRVQSSHPEQEFKVEVRSSEGLRLKCINRIN